MRMRPVTSSALAAVGYDDATRRLRVRFVSGALYEYGDVSPFVHAALLFAESKGAYFQDQIRDRYQVTRLE